MPENWFNKSTTRETGQFRQLAQSGFRYALSLSHHHQDAEDLVQQAWLKLQQKGSPPIVLGSLFKTIRNLFIDSLRRKGIIEFETLPEEILLAGEPASEPGVTGDLDYLLGQLKAGDRELLYLHCVEGYTAREISDLVGRPRGTILSSINRAKSRLRELAAKQEPPSIRTAIKSARP
ncbi:MAG: RNA polymerase sigma factor [Verrucomicrobiales bacterium]